MKFEGAITMRFGQNGLSIDLFDEKSNTNFATVNLSPEELTTALSGLHRTPCAIEVRSLENVGKTHKVDKFIFEIPKELYQNSKLRDEISEIGKPQLSEGWVIDNHYGSKDSFIEKDGKYYARATIRRWD